MSLNIYLISQDINTGYDTFDSAVVAAENEEEARNINPSGFDLKSSGYPYGDWVNEDEKHKITVQLIGIANENIDKGLILASFNAG